LLATFLGPLFIPVRMGSSHALWQAKVEPALQGRVFAVRRAISQIGFPLGLLLVGPLADDVAVPAMRGPLGHTLQPLFGAGPGRGYALMMVGMGLFTALVYLLGALLPAIRNVEADLPDAVPVAG
jgi:DHA3 family macrolide efflux protein-like MFS transporter